MAVTCWLSSCCTTARVWCDSHSVCLSRWVSEWFRDADAWWRCTCIIGWFLISGSLPSFLLLFLLVLLLFCPLPSPKQFSNCEDPLHGDHDTCRVSLCVSMAATIATAPMASARAAAVTIPLSDVSLYVHGDDNKKSIYVQLTMIATKDIFLGSLM